MFSLFSQFFFLLIIRYIALFRLSSLSPLRKTPPSLDLEYFLLMHTYIYITDSVSLHGDAFSLLETRTGFLHSFFPSRCGWPSVAGESLLPLGYLLLFLTVCPHKQNGGLLFLLLWYGGEGWRYSNIRREGEEGEEGGRGEVCLRRGSGMSGNRFRDLTGFNRFQSV